ncbi:MAG: DNA-binding protein [Gemmatimonadota bacterium]|jgi:hypothetical protein|nr:DNA-binding protein [Gemmatimonadota bacterium]
MSTLEKSLFLAWHKPGGAWYPIGRLDVSPSKPVYTFRYIEGVREAERKESFGPLVVFPHFDRVYQSNELFSLFQNRVMNSRRSDFADYLRSLDLDPECYNPIEVLAVTEGRRETDTLEVFPRITKDQNGNFTTRFFIHGLSYLNRDSQERAMRLLRDEPLGVSLELTNPTGLPALQLTTGDYVIMGWTPRYLVSDLREAIPRTLRARVVQVNSSDAPRNRRILVEISGRLPDDLEPMSGDEFRPLTEVPEGLPY